MHGCSIRIRRRRWLSCRTCLTAYLCFSNSIIIAKTVMRAAYIINSFCNPAMASSEAGIDRWERFWGWGGGLWSLWRGSSSWCYELLPWSWLLNVMLWGVWVEETDGWEDSSFQVWSNIYFVSKSYFLPTKNFRETIVTPCFLFESTLVSNILLPSLAKFSLKDYGSPLNTVARLTL